MISPISLVLGILAGLYRSRWPDRVISIGSLLTISLPDFVIGLLLIVLFSWYLKWLPGDSSLRGQDLNISEHWRKLVLPAVTAAFVLVGYLTRVTRISMIAVMDSAYIRTAVLKGLRFRTVIFRHALRNALIAPIAVITTQIAWLVGGLIVIEQLFNYPGIGSLFATRVARQRSAADRGGIDDHDHAGGGVADRGGYIVYAAESAYPVWLGGSDGDTYG